MAAPAHVQEALKLLSQRAGSSKTRVRIEAIRGVVLPSVRKPDFPEAACRVLVKFLLPTAERYRDVASQRAVEDVIRASVEHHGHAAVKSVTAAVCEIGRSVAKTSHSMANGSMAYVGLRWAAIVVAPVLKADGAAGTEFKDLVTAMSEISSAILASCRKSVLSAARRCFARIFAQVSIDPFISVLAGLTPSQEVLCLLHYTLSFASSKRDTGWNQRLPAFLELYVKAVVGSKVRVAPHVQRCTASLLCHVTHEQFKDILLPAVEKGLLRSPEQLMPALSSLLDGVSLDLSAYAMAIGKRIATQLHSQDLSRRQASVAAVTSLSKQCSDASAVQDFAKHLFAVLGGSEGKLTGAEQRVGVLSGIGAMAHNGVVGSSTLQPLVAGVIKQFLPGLSQEVHEGTLVHSLAMLSAWSSRLVTAVPDDLLAAIKKNMSLKTASSSVRFAYLQLLNCTMKGDMLVQGGDVMPVLLQALERAVAQPHQVPVVSEAISASLLLARLAFAQPEAESKFSSFWQTALDPSKQLLVAEKVIAQASVDALVQLLNFTQSLLFDHQERLTAKNNRPFFTALVGLLVHSSYDVRRKALVLVQKIVNTSDTDSSSSKGNAESGAALLRTVFGEYLTAQVVPAEGAEDSESSAAATSSSATSSPASVAMTASSRSHHFVRAFRAVMRQPVTDSGASIQPACVNLLIQSIVWAHHPMIVHGSASEWTRLLERYHADVDTLVEQPHFDRLLATLTQPGVTDRSISVSSKRAVQTLALVCPKFASACVGMLAESVDDVRQVMVGEVRILRTPEGQLCDTSLIDSAKATGSAKAQNMKRESKLYSFDDQKWEIEFREEQQRKKEQAAAASTPAPTPATSSSKAGGKAGSGKAAGKGGKVSSGGAGKSASAAVGAGVQLSKKQQDMIEATLKQESATRQRVQVIEDKLVTALSFVQCAATSNPLSLRQHMPELVGVLRQLMRSPLSAELASRVWVRLTPVAFDDEEEEELKSLGVSIAWLSLRLLDVLCPVDGAWCQESLLANTQRVLAAFHAALQRPTQLGSVTAVQAPLSAPAFCFCFPMLECVLAAISYVPGASNFNRVADQLASDMPTLLDTSLAVVGVHCRMRGAAPEAGLEDDLDEDGPAFLPTAGMFRLLTHIIANGTDVKVAKLQQSACSSLVALCQALSGAPGCGHLSETDLRDVLLPALKSQCDELRRAVLNGLLEALELTREQFGLVMDDKPAKWSQDIVDAISCHVWMLKYDEEEINKSLAERLWESADMCTDNVISSEVIASISNTEHKVRVMASQGLAAILELEPEEVFANCQTLFDVYEQHRTIPKAQVDSMGRPTGPAPEDPWAARGGVAMALNRLTPIMKSENVAELFAFYAPRALNDANADVRKEMLLAATAAIEEHGKDEVTALLAKFEDCLALPDSQSSDALRQSVVILMGTLARHLDKEDPKVRPIVHRLIATLDTPSQQVQEAVANCLPPLVPAIKGEAKQMVADLLAKLLEGTQFAERKGAGYGLAGLVKGLGIGSLKQMNIMPTLNEAVQNKKNYRHREGALFAFEMLCLMLGRLFEPYVIHVLPHLLLCFGDGNSYVRQAADDTARAVMQKLSAHGVKLVLPSLLQAIEDDSWRTKIGSVELLGAMAYCAPKQLSSSLPLIVPKLTSVLADSHIKVQTAGGQALKQIGSVIKNPEIQVIVPTLLDALADPAHHTAAGLQALLDTAFVHMIDAPSLALIMPILERALAQRSTDIKKMACQIMSSMYTLTDHKDLSPYLAAIVPGVKASLLDPLPEVRGVAAKALGAMVKGHGDESFDELMPWLLEVLTSESNTVDRSGSAQGLSEVLGAQGLGKLQSMMAEFVTAAQQQDATPSYRDGYLMLFVYLPVTFGDAFVPFITDVIPPILKGLADEAEYVRETALRAGQRIINMFADTAVAVFLPELELGMFDEHWRIRHSSMALLGDLLYRLSGVTGKMTTEGDEDDGFGTETSQKAILLALGDERRNRVLAGVYMGRCDVALLVRQAALHVWKVVVANTPRTLREILPTLFQLLLGCLASTSYDKRQVAARTLGDLVRKLGERVLPDIIPILERGLDSAESDERQGVCIGLTEIMASTSRDQVMQFVDSLVPTVRRALCDDLPKVRKAAAQTFDRLHNTIGPQALQQILPPLLKILSDDGPSSDAALDGLQQVMAVKSKDVLPFLIPKLTAPPVNSRALAKLASVAGESLNRHLGRILQALLEAIEEAAGTPQEDAELANAQLLVLSITEDMAIQTVVEELLTATKHQEPPRRRAAARLLQVFAAKTTGDILVHVPALMRGLLKLFADPDQDVVAAAWEALHAVTKTLSAPDQLAHIGHLRMAIKVVQDDAINGLLPGFCLGPKKGIAPVLPMLREGILNGPPEMKEQAASGLGDVISMTTAESLKMSVVPIAGPLIRILGDRFAWSVKVAVLDTLRILITKVGAVLKPFLPQLQTTFIKALNDSNRTVRVHAASALQCLVALHSRVDPLFTELHNGVKNVEDPAIRETILQALRGVLVGAGSKMSEALRKSVTSTLIDLLSSPKDELRIGACGCVGAMCTVTPAADLPSLVRDNLLTSDPGSDWTVRHGYGLALAEVTSQGGEAVEDAGLRGEVVACAISHSQSDRIPVCLAGIRCLGNLWAVSLRRTGSSASVESSVTSALSTCLAHGSGEVRMAAARGVRRAVRSGDTSLGDVIAILPALVSNSREKTSPAKLAADLALVSLLKLHSGDSLYQSVLSKLDSTLSGQLQEVHKRALNRLSQEEEVEDDDEEDSVSFTS